MTYFVIFFDILTNTVLYTGLRIIYGEEYLSINPIMAIVYHKIQCKTKLIMKYLRKSKTKNKIKRVHAKKKIDLSDQ